LTDSNLKPNSRLSKIDTSWNLVRRSQTSEHDGAEEAQRKLLELYGSAIKRYLVASLQDVEAAEDLFQEFALKFVQGKLRNADPAKGRFRNYVKAILYRMIADHYRSRPGKIELQLSDDHVASRNLAFDTFDEDQRFLSSWREELLARTWRALEEFESVSGISHFSALRLRASNPTLSSTALAEKLSEQLGKTVTSGAARVMVHRARDKFAGMLIEVIAESLDEPSRTNIEAELIDVRLIDYCREALDA